MIWHVIRRELAARWILLPASILIGALAMAAIHSIGHVRGDADGIMNGTWVGTLVVSTIVGMSLLNDELSNSRLSFYFARPFSPHAIFGGKLAAGVLLALLMQIAIVVLVALALPELSWRDSALAKRHVLSVGGERVLATVGCTLLGMAASIALGSKTRWFVIDVLGLAIVGVLGTWFVLRLQPDPAWLPSDSIRSAGEKAVFYAAALAIAVIGLGLAIARALAFGRTDRMRAHRTLSTTLWPIVVPAMVCVAFVGAQTEPQIPDPPVVADDVLLAPKVESPDVFADDVETVPVPYLLVLDESGVVRIGAAATWEKFDAKRVRLTKRLPPPEAQEQSERFLSWRADEGMSGDLAVASVSALQEQIEREIPHREAVAREQRKSALLQRLYYYVGINSRHVRLDVDQFTSRQADLLARAAGILGLAVDREGPGFPHRHAWSHGSVRAGRKIARRRALVIAAPTAKAKTLVHVVARSRASIVVAHGGKLRPLSLDFRGGAGTDGNWIELRVSPTQIMVEAVPGTPVDVRNIHDLPVVIAKVREVHGLHANTPVDVLVDSEVDSQRLVDILVALDARGIRTIGLGHMPQRLELALRGRHLATTSVKCSANCNGFYLQLVTSMPRFMISRCYRDALLADPTFSGSMTVRVIVDTAGKVTSAVASGLDDDVADCITAVFRSLALSKRHHARVFSSRSVEFAIILRP